MKKAALAACLGFIILLITACNQAQGPKEAAPATPKTAALEPVKAEPSEVPPKELRKDEPNIKVKRGKNGEYTWDISGRDLKAIMEADRILRKRFGEGKPE